MTDAGTRFDLTVPDALCRYCQHELADEQERRWGMCGFCYDGM